MTMRFGDSLAIGHGGVGRTTLMRGHPPFVRDETMWRWKQQFLKRPFDLRLRSGRFAAYTILLPEEWSPAKGTFLPLGEVQHLVLARRLNRGGGGSQRFGRRLPFWVPLLALTAHIAGDVTPIVIGGKAGIRAQYDLAHAPCRGLGSGMILPRSNSRLFQLALDMEERMIDASLGLAEAVGPPLLPNYYAAFARRPEDSTRAGAETVEETRTAIDLVMETLAGNGVLPESLASPGGKVLEIEEHDGWKVITFLASTEKSPTLVHRFLPPSALLQPFVEPGTEIERGTRLGYYATPRKYPSWRAAKEEVLKDAAWDVLSEVVKALDIRHEDYVLRDVRLCPQAVRERRHATIYEDVADLLQPDGTPRIAIASHAAVFSEFSQNGASFRADIWSIGSTAANVACA